MFPQPSSCMTLRFLTNTVPSLLPSLTVPHLGLVWCPLVIRLRQCVLARTLLRCCCIFRIPHWEVWEDNCVLVFVLVTSLIPICINLGFTAEWDVSSSLLSTWIFVLNMSILNLIKSWLNFQFISKTRDRGPDWTPPSGNSWTDPQCRMTYKTTTPWGRDRCSRLKRLKTYHSQPYFTKMSSTTIPMPHPLCNVT